MNRRRKAKLIGVVGIPLALAALMAHGAPGVGGGVDLAQRAARDAAASLDRSHLPGYLPRFPGSHPERVETHLSGGHPRITIVYVADDPITPLTFSVTIHPGATPPGVPGPGVVVQRTDCYLVLAGGPPGLTPARTRRILRHAPPVSYDTLEAVP